LLLDAEPRTLAEQMTMYESKFFMHITPGDFLHNAFEKSEKSPALQETIKVFNRFTNLVTTCMVCTENIKQRTGLLTRFIETAYVRLCCVVM
jgi:RasGEF domain